LINKINLYSINSAHTKNIAPNTVDGQGCSVSFTANRIVKDIFDGSSLNRQQKEIYLSLYSAYKNAAKNESVFTQILKGKIPNRKPIIEIRRNGKLSVGVILNAFPVNRGHALVVPKRQISSIFEATRKEREDIHTGIVRYKNLLKKSLKDKGLPIPKSYNIGINDGFEAGQSIPHLHVHVIPRYLGDVSDPRGGVTGVKGSEEGTFFDGRSWAKQKYSGLEDSTIDEPFNSAHIVIEKK